MPLDMDTTINIGESVTLNAALGNGDYTWSPDIYLSCSFCSSTIARPEESTAYTLNFVDSNGCAGVTIIDVEVINELDFFLSSAFTPNGDHVNEVFYPLGLSITEEAYSFLIFNRWGEEVFTSNDPDQGWDGRFNGELVPQDVYVWKIKFKDSKGKLQNKVGKVTNLW